MNSRCFCLVVLLPLFSLAADFGLTRSGSLDQTALTKAYQESEWEQVTKTLEGYLRRHGDSRVSEAERIFAYKYLGVIYAADSLTRSKAESYFTRLLKLSSDVEIVDLYASKRVNELFAEVKNEHVKRQAYEQKLAGKGASPGNTSATDRGSDEPQIVSKQGKQRSPEPIPAKRETRLEDKNGKWVWWTVGIAAAAGVGAGAYYLTTQNSGGKEVVTTQVDPPEP